MPQVWRIVKEKHVMTAFDGEGARRFGGRWNSPGTAMVYTAQSVSLAVLEMLVHLENEAISAAYRLCMAELHEADIETLDESHLSADWPAASSQALCRALGDTWAKERRSLALRVPSAVVPQEYNFLLNPLHESFGQLRVGEPQSFSFDPRLGT